MSIPQILSQPLTTYYPAELHDGQCWYVNFYAFNPYSKKMEEQRVKINHIKPISERRRFAKNLIRNINNKLESGWNPFIKLESKKQFKKLTLIIETYKKAEYKSFEDETIRTYDSYFNRLIELINKVDREMLCGSFTERIASDFMLDLKMDETICNRTYNNNLLFYRRFFKWMITYKYVDQNPFINIPTISKKFIKKKRRALTREDIRALVEYLEIVHPRFLAACLLEYYCLLRPDDLQMLQRKNFDFKRNVINIFANDTKNDTSSFRVIPICLEKYLKVLDIESLESNDYIFSDHSKYCFAPGKKIMDKRYFANYWAAIVRPALGFGMELQFYSLKDTGITNLMSDGISPVFVQKQADHSSLETTNMYTDKNLPEGYTQLRNLAKPV